MLALRLPHERHYWKFVTGAIVVGLGFSGIAYWQQTRAIRQSERDRQTAISQTADSVAKRTTENVTEAMGKQYGALISEMTIQNNNLRDQLTEQGKAVSTIGKSDFITGKTPVPVTITNGGTPAEDAPEIHVSLMGAAPVLKFGKRASQVILTTNKLMNGARVALDCKNKINSGDAFLAGSDMVMGGSGMQGDHTFVTQIVAPNWSPSFPLVIMLYCDSDDLGGCTVRPLS